jgi:hypothetical protein
MFIVLSNLPEGKHMPDTENIETTSTAAEQDHERDVHLTNPSRRAAAIEAAYILEAVRK